MRERVQLKTIPPTLKSLIEPNKKYRKTPLTIKYKETIFHFFIFKNRKHDVFNNNFLIVFNCFHLF